MMVSLAAHRLAVHADGRWCTQMYETRNETAQIELSAGLADRQCVLAIAWTRSGPLQTGSTASRFRVARGVAPRRLSLIPVWTRIA